MLYFIAFILSCCIVMLLIPPLRKLAVRIDFVDKPQLDSERKIHRQPIPLTAGIAIYISVIAVYLLFVRENWAEAAAITFGGLIMIIIGMVDDWYKTRGKDFPALPKMIVQIVPAILVYMSGVRFVGFESHFTGEYIFLPEWLQFILTVLWIFGVTTVINFSDGMDGLAGGLTAISGTTLFIVALIMGQSQSAFMAAVLVGAAIGYLRYNKPPAKVFMGDAGATFMGFILAVIALDGAFKQATVLSLFIPILALGVPIFDNIRVVIRRMMQGKPIYKADATQVHYQLLRSGLKPVQIVTFLCLLNVCFGLSSIILLLVS